MIPRTAAKESLTVTHLIRKLEIGIRNGKRMDETAKQLVQKLADLEHQRDLIDRDITAIRRTLSLVGIESPLRKIGDLRIEREYAKRKPLRGMALKGACLKVLTDGLEQWFSRSQVEYTLARGGYESDAKDPGNSVDITLRNLADAGLCEVIRQRGVVGNKYRAVATNGGENVVKNPRTTKSTKAGE
jgi:hypothetical protein